MRCHDAQLFLYCGDSSSGAMSPGFWPGRESSSGMWQNATLNFAVFTAGVSIASASHLVCSSRYSFMRNMPAKCLLVSSLSSPVSRPMSAMSPSRCKKLRPSSAYSGLRSVNSRNIISVSRLRLKRPRKSWLPFRNMYGVSDAYSWWSGWG